MYQFSPFSSVPAKRKLRTDKYKYMYKFTIDFLDQFFSSWNIIMYQYG